MAVEGKGRIFNPYMYALNDKRGGICVHVRGGILLACTCALARINVRENIDKRKR